MTRPAIGAINASLRPVVDIGLLTAAQGTAALALTPPRISRAWRFAGASDKDLSGVPEPRPLRGWHTQIAESGVVSLGSDSRTE
jgi:hypothetical protein